MTGIWTERLSMAESLRVMQKRTCQYGGLPNRCDCKYGLAEKHDHTDEHNGCPELTTAIQIIEALSDGEYEDLMLRCNGDKSVGSRSPLRPRPPPEPDETLVRAVIETDLFRSAVKEAVKQERHATKKRRK